MHGPVVVSWLLVAVCGGVGLYRLVRGLREPRGTAGPATGGRQEAAMGLGMALMAVPPEVCAVPPPLLAAAFSVTAAAAVGGAVRAPRGASGAARPSRGHCVHHAVEALAMLYLVLTMAGGGSTSGGAPHTAYGPHAPAGGVPLLTGALMLYFAAYVLRAGLRLAPAAPYGSPAAPPTNACRLALALGSLTMLCTA